MIALYKTGDFYRNIDLNKPSNNEPKDFFDGYTYKQTKFICFLPDAVSCTIEQNSEGLFTMSMQYPIKGENADKIKLGGCIECNISSGKTSFFGIISIEKSTDGLLEITANNILYNINYIYANPFANADIDRDAPPLVDGGTVKRDYAVWKQSNGSMTGSFNFELYGKINAYNSSQLGDLDLLDATQSYDVRLNTCDYKEPSNLKQILLEAIEDRNLILMFDGMKIYFVDMNQKKLEEHADHTLALGRDIVSYNSLINLEDFYPKVLLYAINNIDGERVYVTDTKGPRNILSSNIALPEEIGSISTRIKPIDITGMYGLYETFDMNMLDLCADLYVEEHTETVFNFPGQLNVSALPNSTNDYKIGDSIDLHFEEPEQTKRAVIISLKYDALQDRITEIGIDKVQKDFTHTIAELQKKRGK